MTKIFCDRGYEYTRIDALGGRSIVESRVPKILEAAKHSDWFALVDLDSDDCAPGLLKRWSVPEESKLIRVAVREVESWLLGDAEAFSAFFAIRQVEIPALPEEIPSPKDFVVNLGRRSRKASVRQALVPRENSGRRKGPLYTALLSTFVSESWRPNVARLRCPSLERCLAHLAERFS